jgi:hypothetical protein
MDLSRWVLKAEALLLLVTLASSFLPGRARKACAPLWWSAAATGAAYAFLRYRSNWPMTPMFSASSLYPPLLAIAGAFSLHGRKADDALLLERWLSCAGVVAVGLAVCFPKDFYLPIIKTVAIEAHGVLFFGAIGRACFIVAGGWAWAAIKGRDQVMFLVFRWTIWGFVWWTLSLFCGEAWSYSGWGVPMVWEDASTLTANATWLFYVGVIHLHLGGLASRRTRAAMSIVGVVVVVVLNGLPDLGPWRTPFAWEALP